MLAALVLLAHLAPAPATTPPPVAAYAVEQSAGVTGLEAAHRRVQAAWSAGDREDAVVLIRDYLRTLGRPPRGADPHAWIWLQAARFGDPSPRACGALPADPHTVAQLVDFGWWLAHAGDDRGAVDLLEAVLARSPDVAQAHLIVAESRLRLGDVADARRHAAIYLALTGAPPSS